MPKVIFRPPTAVRDQVKDVELDISFDMLVENIRKKVEKKLGIDDALKLTLHGKTLDDEKPLRLYNPKEGDIINMTTQNFNSYMPRGEQPVKRSREEEDDDVVQEVSDKKPRLLVDEKLLVEEASIKREGFEFRAAVHGEQGQRRQMEDTNCICTSLRAVNEGVSEDRDFAIFAVFDGHGGKQTATFVRQAFPAELATQVVKVADEPMTDKTMRKILNDTFARVDHRIATEQSGVMDGCCGIVILSFGAKCWIANLGDSAAYLAREAAPGTFKAIPLSNQHNCFAMKEKERILRMGGAVENGRINGILNVTRAFGDIHLKKFGVISQPDLMKVTIDPDQDRFIIIGSDGLFSSTTALETVELVSELMSNQEDGGGDVKELCSELLKDTIENKQVQDNVTGMLLVVKPA
jgi:integrin-linked kinase-associated serine/threonine phosphatase 2C